ncbi:MAG TPA: SDR family NAD(P)-dependent oxidoreductase, partial [Vicinamibacterales bacterium]
MREVLVVLKGRVAIVTGGTRGIGAAISEHLAKDHAHIAAGYSKGEETARKLKERLEGDGASIS